jgi:signal transduction histidine kinase
MHPAIFIGGFVALGILFALQVFMGDRMWSYKLDLALLLEIWGVQYFLWGVICWLLWFWLGPQIQTAPLPRTVAVAVPVSILAILCEEMIWVACFPSIPLRKRPMSYVERLEFQLYFELVASLLIFWCTFFLIRGIGYYQRFREKESVARQLESQLAEARIRALRMQLNPHFLFNSLNGISSLMHSDVAAADTMLEQLACLFRITLERGEIQLIPLIDEMEFVEMYVAVQQQRFAGRMRHEISVESGLHDALVPAMILQPLIENAYAHGLTHIVSDGLLFIGARRDHNHLTLTVLNTGVGILPVPDPFAKIGGVGLKNVQSRLRLHYGDDHQFTLQALNTNNVEAKITIPLQLSVNPSGRLKGYGV